MSARKRFDRETIVLHTILRLLSQLVPPARRRVLSYVGARADGLPFIDASGNIVEEFPEDQREPPMISFINQHKATQEAS